jgi:hypothetical protein
MKHLFKFLLWAVPTAFALTTILWGLSQAHSISVKNANESRYFYEGTITKVVALVSSPPTYKIYFAKSKPIIVSELDQSPDILIGQYCEIITNGNGEIIHITTQNWTPENEIIPLQPQTNTNNGETK